MEGKLGYSLAGHDKDKIYYILRENQDYLWMCDGDIRPMEKPKKKNKKHVQIIGKDLSVAPYSINSNSLTNEMIKRTIKLYMKDI